MVKMQRMAMTPAQRKKPVRRVPWQYPIAAEKTYARLLKGWLSRLITFTEDFIKRNAEKMIRGDSAEQEIRADALPGGTFDILVNSLNGWMATYVPETPDRDYSGAPTVWMGLGKMADGTNDTNWMQWKNQTKTSIGIEFPKDEPWWDSTKTRWQEENYKYFRKLGVEYTTKISELAERAVVNGESVKTLRENIRRLGANISGPRANLIARDQIGKLNGMITQGRMTDVGLEMYIWETAGDERVRGQPGGKYADAVPSHAAMDYKLCRWDNSAVYSEDGGKTWIDRPPNAVRVHPGMDIQCRCVGTPYWEEMIGEADKDAFGGPQMEVTEPVAPTAAKSMSAAAAGVAAALKSGNIATNSENAKRAREAARKMYPDEKWVKIEPGIYESQTAIDERKTSKSEKERAHNKKVHTREMEQARLLASRGDTVYFLPRSMALGVKTADSITNGSPLELKMVEGNNPKTVADRFVYSRGQSKDVFIYVKSDLSPKKVLSELTQTVKVNGYDNGIIQIYFEQIDKYYVWEIKALKKTMPP
jgi:tmRNA-binding protein